MKRILASLLSLLLVLSMALAFTACDSVAGTLPDEGNKNPSAGSTDTPDDTGKTYTEAEAKIALAGMTAQLGAKKNFASDITLSVNMGMNGMNTTVQIPVSLEADLEAALYHARIDVPGILMTMLGGENSGLTVEMYLTPDGAYFGTDGDVTDDLGEPAVAYRYEPGLTSDLVAQILGWLQADGDTPEQPDAGTGAEQPATPGASDLNEILSGLTARPKTELKLVGGEKGGYLLTASVDVKDVLNTILPMMQNLLQISPKTIAAQYLTGELLRSVGEMTVSDVLTLIDGYIGEEATDRILGVIMDAMTPDTMEADDGESGTEEPVVSETRAAFLSIFGDSKVIELVLGFIGDEGDDAPAYDPNMTEEETAAFYEALAENLLGMIPDEEIGKITVPGTETTIGDLLKGVTFTDCHASVTFSLTETYLPTAVTAEAAAAVLKTPKSTYACTIGATASLSFDRTVTLPEEMPVLPVENTYCANGDGENLTVSVSYFSNDFTLSSATIVNLNGEAANIKAVMDEETQTVTFTGIPQTYIDGEAQMMTLDIEVVFTRTVGERTYTYTLLLTEQYYPTTENV